MTELRKIMLENRLTALDAILSAIKVSLKWLLEEYPVSYESKAERESMKEIRQNLEKAQSCLENYIQTLFPLEDENVS